MAKPKTNTGATAPVNTSPVQSPGRIIWRRFKKHRLAVASAVFLIFLGLMAILAPLVAPYNYRTQDLAAGRQLLPVGTPGHVLGTDELGRDILSRLIYGSQVSLGVGFSSMAVSVVIGMIVGALAGYYGGWLDNLLMRFTDMVLAFPSLFLLIVLAAFIGPSPTTIILIIGGLSWMGVARLVRSSFLSLKQQEFAEAARALGLQDYRIIVGHILPNAMAPVIVAATLGVAYAILYESALSYLGLGVQPPLPTWGNMLSQAQAYLLNAPMLVLFPGLAIFLTVLAINFLGDGLRDALDPRLKE
ncbi:MAG: oligopeptide ABC transporter permease [Bacillota bacterium]